MRFFMDYSNCGVSQRIISELADVVPSSVSRYIKECNYKPIDGKGTRNLKYKIEDARKIIRHFIKLPKNIVKKRHAFYNFKGGVGKTSICYQVSSHVALMGYNVLVVDSDPQAHLTASCGFGSENDFLTLYDAVVSKIKIGDIIKNVYPGLDCIPSNLSLTRLEVDLNQMPKREERIKFVLESIEKDYDFIFFDTNPTISHLNRNIITYVDVLNVVCETQPYSLNGLKILWDHLNNFFESMRIDSCDIMVIPNKYEDRTSSSGEAMMALRKYYSEYIKTDFAIRKSEEINTSAKLCQPLAFFAKKNSNAFEDILELSRYVVQKST